MPAMARRLTRESPHGGPFAEPSATIIWKTLRALGIAHDVVIWNALQLHAHRPGERWTNRTPTPAEFELGAPALQIVLDAFPDAKVIAIGKKAEALLREMDVVPNGQVRHPANGGARAFADALRHLV